MIPQIIASALALLCPANGQPFDPAICAEVPTVQWELVAPDRLGVLGMFLPGTRTVTITDVPNLDPRISPADGIVPLVAHELTHARQYAENPAADHNANCYPMELAAWTEEGRAWKWLWNDQPPNTVYGTSEMAMTLAVTGPASEASAECRQLGLLH